ncbi:divergent polysaccharide deacetylase family protein, partial [Salinispira pacifica]
LKRDGLFFLDSRTTATSVARSVAARFGVQFAGREVFLDNVQTRDAILEQFRSAERIAAERGYAVMIGHVWTDPLAGIIKELYPKLLEQGYVFGALSDLVHAPQVASGGSSAAGGQ